METRPLPSSEPLPSVTVPMEMRSLPSATVPMEMRPLPSATVPMEMRPLPSVTELSSVSSLGAGIQRTNYDVICLDSSSDEEEEDLDDLVDDITPLSEISMDDSRPLGCSATPSGGSESGGAHFSGATSLLPPKTLALLKQHLLRTKGGSEGPPSKLLGGMQGGTPGSSSAASQDLSHTQLDGLLPYYRLDQSVPVRPEMDLDLDDAMPPSPILDPEFHSSPITEPVSSADPVSSPGTSYHTFSQSSLGSSPLSLHLRTPSKGPSLSPYSDMEIHSSPENASSHRSKLQRWLSSIKPFSAPSVRPDHTEDSLDGSARGQGSSSAAHTSDHILARSSGSPSLIQESGELSGMSGFSAQESGMALGLSSILPGCSTMSELSSMMQDSTMAPGLSAVMQGSRPLTGSLSPVLQESSGVSSTLQGSGVEEGNMEDMLATSAGDLFLLEQTRRTSLERDRVRSHSAAAKQTSCSVPAERESRTSDGAASAVTTKCVTRIISLTPPTFIPLLSPVAARLLYLSTGTSLPSSPPEDAKRFFSITSSYVVSPLAAPPTVTVSSVGGAGIMNSRVTSSSSLQSKPLSSAGVPKSFSSTVIPMETRLSPSSEPLPSVTVPMEMGSLPSATVPMEMRPLPSATVPMDMRPLPSVTELSSVSSLGAGIQRTNYDVICLDSSSDEEEEDLDDLVDDITPLSEISMDDSRPLGCSATPSGGSESGGAHFSGATSLLPPKTLALLKQHLLRTKGGSEGPPSKLLGGMQGGTPGSSSAASQDLSHTQLDGLLPYYRLDQSVPVGPEMDLDLDDAMPPSPILDPEFHSSPITEPVSSADPVSSPGTSYHTFSQSSLGSSPLSLHLRTPSKGSSLSPYSDMEIHSSPENASSHRSKLQPWLSSIKPFSTPSVRPDHTEDSLDGSTRGQGSSSAAHMSDHILARSSGSSSLMQESGELSGMSGFGAQESSIALGLSSVLPGCSTVSELSSMMQDSTMAPGLSAVMQGSQPLTGSLSPGLQESSGASSTLQGSGVEEGNMEDMLATSAGDLSLLEQTRRASLERDRVRSQTGCSETSCSMPAERESRTSDGAASAVTTKCVTRIISLTPPTSIPLLSPVAARLLYLSTGTSLPSSPPEDAKRFFSITSSYVVSPLAAPPTVTVSSVGGAEIMNSRVTSSSEIRSSADKKITTEKLALAKKAKIQLKVVKKAGGELELQRDTGDQQREMTSSSQEASKSDGGATLRPASQQQSGASLHDMLRPRLETQQPRISLQQQSGISLQQQSGISLQQQSGIGSQQQSGISLQQHPGIGLQQQQQHGIATLDTLQLGTDLQAALPPRLGSWAVQHPGAQIVQRPGGAQHPGWGSQEAQMPSREIERNLLSEFTSSRIEGASLVPLEEDTQSDSGLDVEGLTADVQRDIEAALAADVVIPMLCSPLPLDRASSAEPVHNQISTSPYTSITTPLVYEPITPTTTVSFVYPITTASLINSTITTSSLDSQSPVSPTLNQYSTNYAAATLAQAGIGHEVSAGLNSAAATGLTCSLVYPQRFPPTQFTSDPCNSSVASHFSFPSSGPPTPSMLNSNSARPMSPFSHPTGVSSAQEPLATLLPQACPPVTIASPHDLQATLSLPQTTVISPHDTPTTLSLPQTGYPTFIFPHDTLTTLSLPQTGHPTVISPHDTLTTLSLPQAMHPTTVSSLQDFHMTFPLSQSVMFASPATNPAGQRRLSPVSNINLPVDQRRLSMERLASPVDQSPVGNVNLPVDQRRLSMEKFVSPNAADQRRLSMERLTSPVDQSPVSNINLPVDQRRLSMEMLASSDQRRSMETDVSPSSHPSDQRRLSMEQFSSLTGQRSTERHYLPPSTHPADRAPSMEFASPSVSSSIYAEQRRLSMERLASAVSHTVDQGSMAGPYSVDSGVTAPPFNNGATAAFYGSNPSHGPFQQPGILPTPLQITAMGMPSHQHIPLPHLSPAPGTLPARLIAPPGTVNITPSPMSMNTTNYPRSSQGQRPIGSTPDGGSHPNLVGAHPSPINDGDRCAPFPSGGLLEARMSANVVSNPGGRAMVRSGDDEPQSYYPQVGEVRRVIGRSY